MKDFLIKNKKKKAIEVWVWRKSNYKAKHSVVNREWTHAIFNEEKNILTFFLEKDKVTKIEKSLNMWFGQNYDFCDYFDLPKYLRDRYDELNGIQVINNHISKCNKASALKYKLKTEDSVPVIKQLVNKEVKELPISDFESFIKEFLKRANTHHKKILQIRTNPNPPFMSAIQFKTPEDKKVILDMVESLKYSDIVKPEIQCRKDVEAIAKVPIENKNLAKECKNLYPSIRMSNSRSREDYLVDQVLKVLNERNLIKNLEEVKNYISLDADGVSIVINIPNCSPLPITSNSGRIYFDLLKLFDSTTNPK